jgi:hypothetical protein
MESLVLNPRSKDAITAYMADHCFVAYERNIFNEMLQAIAVGDQTQLDWFQSFGVHFRAITMNVNAYRKGLEFGFTEIAFNEHGWFKNPQFIDIETLTFGDTSRYGNNSTITLGKGANAVWTYAMNYSYGVAGGCYGLSVYGKQFKAVKRL